MKNRNYITMRNEYKFGYAVTPMALYENEKYAGLSTAAICLYSLLLNLTSLSVRNHWSKMLCGREAVYVFFTREQAQKKLRCGNNKAIKTFKELQDSDLIDEVSQKGMNKANLIFVKMPEEAKRDTELVSKVQKQRKSRKQKGESILRRIYAAILSNKRILEQQEAAKKHNREEWDKLKQVTVDQKTIQSIRSHLEYDFVRNIYGHRKDAKKSIRMLDTVVHSISEMVTYPITTVNIRNSDLEYPGTIKPAGCGTTIGCSKIAYTKEYLSDMLGGLNGFMVMQIIRRIQECRNFKKITHSRAYIKSVIIDFLGNPALQQKCKI